MRWRAICERRFERVTGDRTGFVSLDSNTDQPLDGPPGPAVSPIAEQPPLLRRTPSLRAQCFLTDRADAAESSAWRAPNGATCSWHAPHLRQNEASTAHSKPTELTVTSPPFSPGGSARPAAPPPPPRRPRPYALRQCEGRYNEFRRLFRRRPGGQAPFLRGDKRLRAAAAAWPTAR